MSENIRIQDDNFIMLPTIDFVFKLLFGDVNHKERLISLLSALLKIPIEEFEGIEILNSELQKLFKDDKLGILDIRAKMKDGKQLDIEIQVLPTVYMPERSLYYWSKMYTTQAKEGDSFKVLKKCITINILDYKFLPVKKMHTCYHLKEDDTGHQLTDVIEVHFCELEKLRSMTEISDLNDPSVDWLRFIGAKTKGEMEMIANGNEMIKDAYNYLQVISKDEQKRLAYEARQMDLMDRKTREEEAEERGRKEGIKEGIEEGIEEGIKKVAREALKDGADVSFVAKITKLDISTIKEIQKEINNK